MCGATFHTPVFFLFLFVHFFFSWENNRLGVSAFRYQKTPVKWWLVICRKHENPPSSFRPFMCLTYHDDDTYAHVWKRSSPVGIIRSSEIVRLSLYSFIHKCSRRFTLDGSVLVCLVCPGAHVHTHVSCFINSSSTLKQQQHTKRGTNMVIQLTWFGLTNMDEWMAELILQEKKRRLMIWKVQNVVWKLRFRDSILELVFHGKTWNLF